MDVETYTSNSTIRLYFFVEGWLYDPNVLHAQTFGYHDTVIEWISRYVQAVYLYGVLLAG